MVPEHWRRPLSHVQTLRRVGNNESELSAIRAFGQNVAGKRFGRFDLKSRDVRSKNSAVSPLVINFRHRVSLVITPCVPRYLNGLHRSRAGGGASVLRPRVFCVTDA
jgi:hypothetical protein